MVHKAIAQTIITSMQNLSLAELTINFSNTTACPLRHAYDKYGPFDSDQTAGQKLAHRSSVLELTQCYSSKVARDAYPYASLGT